MAFSQEDILEEFCDAAQLGQRASNISDGWQSMHLVGGKSTCRNKALRALNPKKFRAYDRERYLRDKETRLAQQKVYHAIRGKALRQARDARKKAERHAAKAAKESTSVSCDA